MRATRIGTMASAGGAAVDEWDGFYYFAPTTGTDVYVADAANGGSDSNDGLTTGTPKLTLAAGVALLTDGQPDRLWLHRGSSWSGEEFGTFALTGGLSATEPMIIGAYGTYTDARPQLTANAVFFTQTTGVEFLVVQDLDIVADAGRSNTGFGAFSGVIVSDTMIVQGCRIHNFAIGLEFDGNGTGGGLILHRNLVSDAWSDNNSAHGCFVREMAGAVTITGNIFDRCGYATSAFNAGNNSARNLIMQSNCDGVNVIEDNWSVRSAGNGAQLRSGGTTRRNGFVSNVDGFTYCLVTATTTPHAAVADPVEDNYVDNSADLAPLSTGFGIHAAHLAPGATLRRNLVTNCSSTGINSWGIALAGGTVADSVTQVITGLDMRDNVVHETERPLLISGAMGTEIDGVVVEDNELGTSLAGSADYALDVSATVNSANITFSGNAYRSGKATNAWIRNGGVASSVATWSAAEEADAIDGTPTYTDDTRTVATYLDVFLSTTGSTRVDFFDELRLQRRGNWRSGLETTTVLNWVRAGFDMAAIA